MAQLVKTPNIAQVKNPTLQKLSTYSQSYNSPTIKMTGSLLPAGVKLTGTPSTMMKPLAKPAAKPLNATTPTKAPQHPPPPPQVPPTKPAEASTPTDSPIKQPIIRVKPAAPPVPAADRDTTTVKQEPKEIHVVDSSVVNQKAMPETPVTPPLTAPPPNKQKAKVTAAPKTVEPAVTITANTISAQQQQHQDDMPDIVTTPASQPSPPQKQQQTPPPPPAPPMVAVDPVSVKKEILSAQKEQPQTPAKEDPVTAPKTKGGVSARKQSAPKKKTQSTSSGLHNTELLVKPTNKKVSASMSIGTPPDLTNLTQINDMLKDQLPEKGTSGGTLARKNDVHALIDVIVDQISRESGREYALLDEACEKTVEDRAYRDEEEVQKTNESNAANEHPGATSAVSTDSQRTTSKVQNKGKEMLQAAAEAFVHTYHEKNGATFNPYIGKMTNSSAQLYLHKMQSFGIEMEHWTPIEWKRYRDLQCADAAWHRVDRMKVIAGKPATKEIRQEIKNAIEIHRRMLLKLALSQELNLAEHRAVKDPNSALFASVNIKQEQAAAAAAAASEVQAAGNENKKGKSEQQEEEEEEYAIQALEAAKQEEAQYDNAEWLDSHAPNFDLIRKHYPEMVNFWSEHPRHERNKGLYSISLIQYATNSVVESLDHNKQVRTEKRREVYNNMIAKKKQKASSVVSPAATQATASGQKRKKEEPSAAFDIRSLKKEGESEREPSNIVIDTEKLQRITEEEEEKETPKATKKQKKTTSKNKPKSNSKKPKQKGRKVHKSNKKELEEDDAQEVEYAQEKDSDGASVDLGDVEVRGSEPEEQQQHQDPRGEEGEEAAEATGDAARSSGDDAAPSEPATAGVGVPATDATIEAQEAHQQEDNGATAAEEEAQQNQVDAIQKGTKRGRKQSDNNHQHQQQKHQEKKPKKLSKKAQAAAKKLAVAEEGKMTEKQPQQQKKAIFVPATKPKLLTTGKK